MKSAKLLKADSISAYDKTEQKETNNSPDSIASQPLHDLHKNEGIRTKRVRQTTLK